MKFLMISARLPVQASRFVEEDSVHQEMITDRPHWLDNLTHPPTHFPLRRVTSESEPRNSSLFPQAFREPVLRFMVPCIPVSWPDRLIGEFSAYFKGSVAVSSGVSPFREASIHPSFLNNACKLAITPACMISVSKFITAAYLLFHFYLGRISA